MLWAESSIKTIGNREEIWSQSFQTLALRFVRANLLSIQKLLDFAAQMWVLINKEDIYVTPFAILLKRYNASLKLNSKILSRGVLLYISHRGMCPPPPPPNRVGFLRRFGRTMGIHWPFWSGIGNGFQGNYGVYECTYRFNSKWAEKEREIGFHLLFCLRSNLSNRSRLIGSWSNDNIISA